MDATHLTQLTDDDGNVYYKDERNRLHVGQDGIYFDITLDDRLILEGEARELTRKVANLRKTLGLNHNDIL